MQPEAMQSGLTQLESGKILDGKVTGITKYGAFVDIGGITGMVHISEVSSTYVKEISDYLKEGDQVKVKILKVGDEGKVSLSIKQASGTTNPPSRQSYGHGNNPKPHSASHHFSSNNKNSESSFEDMLNKFKQNSEEKMSDLKRFIDNKHGSYSRRSK